MQGFMVLALTGSSNLGALREEDKARKIRAQNESRQALAAGDQATAEAALQEEMFGHAELASFLDLYERIKTSDWPMRQFTNSRAYHPGPDDDRCVQNLDDIYEELRRFVPMTRGYLLRQFPAITDTALRIISFLLRESGNITFCDEEKRQSRIDAALDDANESLKRIESDYADLPRPLWPLCGSLGEES
jgi:hypothetical protein